MPKPSSAALTQCLQYLAGVMRADTRTDSELLSHFIESRDEAAFAALVGRYAALVWANCRRILGPTPDAEDAFQATFLALARKSASVRGAALASWLYRVSQRVSFDCRRSMIRRLRRETSAAALLSERVPNVTADDEVAVREELAQLPERLRVPLVLYYLDGKTQAETGRVLGVSDRAIAQRIEQAISSLRKRLEQRGFAVTVAALGTFLGRVTAAQALPDGLLLRVIVAAAEGQVPPTVAALATRALAPRPVPWIAGVLVAVGSVCSAAFLLAAGSHNPSRPPQPPVEPLTATQRPNGVANTQPQLPEPWATLVGNVTDGSGKPVAEARVAVLGRTWNQRGTGLRDEVIAEGSADATGRFRLSVARPIPGEVGVVWLSVSAPGVRTVLAVSVVGGVIPNDIPIRLTPGRVSGRVLDPNGKALAGATVRVVRFGGAAFEPAQADHGLLPAHVWPPPVSTDPDGVFTFTDLDPAADLRMAVVHPASGMASVLELPGGQPGRNNLEVRLPVARRFAGRVIAADTGLPLVSAQVVVDFQQVAGAAPLTRSIRTDREGRFSLGVPAASRWSVAVGSVPVPYLSSHRVIELPSGNGEVLGDFVLERGVVTRGRVVDAASGQPIRLAKVQFFPRTPPAADGDKPAPLHGTTTDADGKFSAAIPQVDGLLSVTAPDTSYLLAEIDPADTHGKRIAAHGVATIAKDRDSGVLSFKLERGLPIQGRVSLPDGSTVADGWVWCHRLIGGRDLRTPHAIEIHDGRFAVPGCRPGRTYTVVLADRNFRYGSVVQLTCSDKPKDIVLEATGSASVEIRDGADRPTAGAMLATELGLPADAGPGEDAPATHWFPLASGGPVGAGGQLHLPGLVPGARYRVGVSQGRSGILTQSILTVPANGHRQTTLVLPEPAMK